MLFDDKSKLMCMLLPLLAACSGGGGEPSTAQHLDTAVAAQSAALPTSTVAPLSDFDIWVQRLMADRISPVLPEAGDLSHTWVGADGLQANVVVRTPRTAGKPTITVSLPPAGEDATPVLQAALAQARKNGGGVVKLAPGEYRFRSGNTEQPNLAHMILSRLTDVDIQASGATFSFEAGLDGIFVQDCVRTRIQGARMHDARVLSGTGRVRMVDGVKQLQLDAPLPGGPGIYWIQAMNEDSHTWPLTQLRGIITPEMPQPVKVGERAYTTPELRAFQDGQYVAVRFTYYAGRAIYVRDSYSGSSEDIVLDGLQIGSVGGMGIGVKMRGRGIAIVNSSITASPGRPYSTNYDGIHLVAAAGDVLIRGNSIAHTGDDLINVRSLIHRATPTGTDTATLTNDARLIRAGDEVAFFNKGGEYLGRRIVSQAPPIGNSDTVTFTFQPGEPFTEAAYARDVNLTARRFALTDNTLYDAAGRGMLIQVANGIVQNNVFRNLPRTAVRMLTSFEPWLEGAGAINVRVSGNTVENGGTEFVTNFPTGIVTAFGELAQGKLPGNMYNGWIKIDGNRFTNPRATCIAVYNTKHLIQENNDCGGKPS
jgi:hypothetical protein